MAAVPSEAGRSDESADSTSWQPVARWYSDYHATRKSDHFTNVIYPGSLALLGDVSNKRVLDVACGEGAFAAHLTEAGAVVTGVDAAPDLIDTAKARRLRGAVFEIGDANDLDSAGDAARGPFDAAACVMAIMNIANLDSTLAGIAARLTAAAPLVLVLLHPAFRSPKQASWGWDEGDPGRPRQYRRVDAYLSESRTPIVMNPGEASRGRPPVETITFHRPLSAYIRSLSNAGFVVDSLEEWPSQRTSEPGPRADEENRARAEIPLFLGIRAIMSRRSH
ncbi:MAG: class I SAM-dependent methyltransferase [Planctomycetota bacterium]